VGRYEDSGLSRISGGRITTFGEDDGLIQNHVRAIFEDREGSLWVGTNGGLVQLGDGKFTTITTQEGLAHDFTRAILETRPAPCGSAPTAVVSTGCATAPSRSSRG